MSSLVYLKREITVSIAAIVALIVIGTIAYHHLENWTYIQSLYFSVVTLSTVGYGDLAPSTEFSRLFTTIYLIVGIGVTLSSLSIIATRYFDKLAYMTAKKRKMEMQKAGKPLKK